VALVILALTASSSEPAVATTGSYRTINLGTLPGGSRSNASAIGTIQVPILSTASGEQRMQPSAYLPIG